MGKNIRMDSSPGSSRDCFADGKRGLGTGKKSITISPSKPRPLKEPALLQVGDMLYRRESFCKVTKLTLKMLKQKKVWKPQFWDKKSQRYNLPVKILCPSVLQVNLVRLPRKGVELLKKPVALESNPVTPMLLPASSVLDEMMSQLEYIPSAVDETTDLTDLTEMANFLAMAPPIQLDTPPMTPPGMAFSTTTLGQADFLTLAMAAPIQFDTPPITPPEMTFSTMTLGQAKCLELALAAPLQLDTPPMTPPTPPETTLWNVMTLEDEASPLQVDDVGNATSDFAEAFNSFITQYVLNEDAEIPDLSNEGDWDIEKLELAADIEVREPDNNSKINHAEVFEPVFENAEFNEGPLKISEFYTDPNAEFNAAVDLHFPVDVDSSREYIYNFGVAGNGCTSGADVGTESQDLDILELTVDPRDEIRLPEFYY